MIKRLRLVTWCLTALTSVSAAAEALREDELSVSSVVQEDWHEGALDLSSRWRIRTASEVAVAYSATGWGCASIASGASVRLTLQSGQFINGVFAPMGVQTQLADGLIGDGAFTWVLAAMEKKDYLLVHEVSAGGRAVESETLRAYFDFSEYEGISPSQFRSAILAVTQPVTVTDDPVHPWLPVGGDGEGLQNDENGANLTFTFAGSGVFFAEYTLSGGAIEIRVDGSLVETLSAPTMGWQACQISVVNYGAHVVAFKFVKSDPNGAVGIRKAGWHAPDASLRSEDQSASLAVDLREGVRTPKMRKEVLPFVYSSTNWVGDVTGATASSVAQVSIVRLTGTDPDVTTWTEEGAPSGLASASGEGSVRWKPQKGVWKATFSILGTDHVENSFFDLREMLEPGLIIFVK